MYCKFCGSQIPDDSTKCPFCAADLNDNPAPEGNSVPEANSVNPAPIVEPDLITTKPAETKAEETKAAPSPTKKPKKKKKGLIIAIAAILTLALVVGGGVFAYTQVYAPSHSSHSSRRDRDRDRDRDKDRETEPEETETEVTVNVTETTPPETVPETTPAETTVSTTNMTAGDSVVAETYPLPEDGSAAWTILVYMCGSNLEGDNGIASFTLDEMNNMNIADNVNVIVETGGSLEWNNDDSFFDSSVRDAEFPTDALGRYQIKNDSIIDLGSVPLESMGKSSTLEEFIAWGTEHFQAQRYMLVIWNHGYVEPYGDLECDEMFYTDEEGNVLHIDELDTYGDYRNDCLTLDELESALQGSCAHFEIMAFNTCLSSSMEIASRVAPYANFMVASEESIPAVIGIPEEYMTYISENPTMDGWTISKHICEQYRAELQEIIDSGVAGSNNAMFSKSTISAIDLSALGEMKDCYDEVMQHLYYSIYDINEYTGFLDAASSCENYGSEGNVEGNLIDLRSFLVNAAPYLTDTEADERLIEIIDGHIYVENGPARIESAGISFFFPSYNYVFNLKAELEAELMDLGYDYTEDQLNEIISSYLEYSFNGYIDNIDNDPDYFWYSSFLDFRFHDYWTQSAEAQAALDAALEGGTEPSTPVVNPKDHTIDYETTIDSNGLYTLNITEGVDSVISVELNAVMCIEMSENTGCDEMYTYLGGTRRDVTTDYTNGVFECDFDCTWFYFGEYPMPCYSIEDTANHTLYGCNAEINDEDCVLVFEYDKATDKAHILYACHTNDTEGVASNDFFYLEAGDVIEVMFYSYTAGDGSFSDYLLIRSFGSVTYTGNEDCYITQAYANSATLRYLVNYTITDVFGNVYYTDFVCYNIVNGSVTSIDYADDVPDEVCNELFALI